MSPVFQSMKASRSAISLLRCSAVDDTPWPAADSMRNKIGRPLEVAADMREKVLNGIQGATRLSFIPEVKRTAG